MNSDGYIAALDVGKRRIGVALAHPAAALSSPHSTIINDDQVWQAITRLAEAEQVSAFVVGLPRGLNGQETEQTAYSRAFAKELETRLGRPVVLQDEAGTSVAAEAELIARRKRYNKGDVDALAATIILEDYLSAQRGKTK